MNKKFMNALLFSAALLSSGAIVTSCDDYDDDINSLETRVSTLEEAVKALQDKFDAGKFITSFTENSSKTGYVLTLSDGSTMEIKNGVNGLNGQNGQNGTTWRINPTTKNWESSNDGGKTWKDEGVSAQGVKGDKGDNGVDAKSPEIDKATGCWALYTWNPETKQYDRTVTAVKAASASSYVVDYPLYYELNMPVSVEGEITEAYKTIKMPKSAVLTSMDVYTEKEGTLNDQPAINYYYARSKKDVEFNGVTYKKGEVLSSANARLTVLLNPNNVAADDYAFALVNSKGESVFHNTSVTPNMTEKPLSRAAANETPNVGFYDMTFALNEGLSVDNNIATNQKALYALTTKNYQGDQISSKFNIGVTAASPSNFNVVFGTGTSVVSVEEGTSFADLLDQVVSPSSSWLATSHEAELGKIADYYFEMPQNQTANAEKSGMKLDAANKVITAEKASTTAVTLVLHYITLDGEVKEQKVKVVAKSTVEASIADFNWTIQADNASTTEDETKVSVLVSNARELAEGGFIANNTNYNVDYKFANDVVIVNGVEMNADKKAQIEEGAAYTPGSLKNILGQIKFYKDGQDDFGYDIWKAEMQFDPTTAYAQPFNAVVKLTNNKNEVKEVSFKVNISAPEYTLERAEAYFKGDVATILDKQQNWDDTNLKAKFDLSDLYGNYDATTHDYTFEEVIPYKDAKETVKAEAWTTSNNNIAVPQYNADEDLGYVNTGIGSTRTFKVSSTPFNNNNLDPVTDEFELSVSTQVYEGVFGYGTYSGGKFTQKKAIEIVDNTEHKAKVSDFAGVLAEDDKSYNFYDDATAWATGDYSKNIQKYEIILDKAAEKNLAVSSTVQVNGNEQYISIKKKENVLISTDTPCVIKVKITDRGGLTKEATINVTLKATVVE